MYVDPADVALAKTVVSKLTKKRILELKIEKCIISDYDSIVESLNSVHIRFAIKVEIYNFHTRTTFEHMYDSKKIFNIAEKIVLPFNNTYETHMVISLIAVESVNAGLPQEFHDLKSNIRTLGYSVLSFAHLLQRKKPMWVPLNNANYGESSGLLGSNENMLLIHLNIYDVKKWRLYKELWFF
jgi:hypothetical protein